ncbi:MAG: GGDEF domain-containing protein [Thermodesulforhabdaceae bacterium]
MNVYNNIRKSLETSRNRIGATPENAQKLRIKRFFLGFLSYTVLWGVIISCYFWGIFRLTLVQTIAFILSSLVPNAIFYWMFRTGFNKRFKDPSLTQLQIAVGIVFAGITIYLMNAYRGIVLIMYFIAFIFGVFRFDRRQFLFMTFFAVTTYGIAISALWLSHPELVELKFEILQGVTLIFTLVWFSFIGDYISSLRKKLIKGYAEISIAYRRLEHLARHDYLTGVFNRMGIMEFLELEIERANRYGTTFSVCIADIDWFKRINDTFGHAVGDSVLKAFVDILSSCTRKTDVVGRYGGEEFLIVLAETPLEFATVCLDRCRMEIEEASFPGLPEDYRVTASFGATEYLPGESIDNLLSRADRALYRAKFLGKNRVVAIIPNDDENETVIPSAERSL